MKKLSKVLLLGLAVMSMSLNSCIFAKGGVVPSGNIITKNIPINDFEKVTAEGSMSVYFEQSSQVGAVLECSDNIAPYVEVFNQGNELVVRYKKGIVINLFGKDSKKNKVKVSIKSPKINSINLNGSGDFIATGDLAAENLSVNLNGSGDIDLKGVRCNAGAQPGAFAAQLNGSGDIVVAGEILANSTAIQLNGSGDIKTKNIVAHTLASQLNGSGDVVILSAIADKSNVELSGSGDLVIKDLRSSNIDSKLNGSGDLSVCRMLADEVHGSVVGSGDMRLTGRCQKAVLVSSGSSELSAAELEAGDVEAQASGSSEISCNAQRDLSASIENSAEITFTGNATVRCATKRQPQRR